jgi:hypothetical protein
MATETSNHSHTEVMTHHAHHPDKPSAGLARPVHGRRRPARGGLWRWFVDFVCFRLGRGGRLELVDHVIGDVVEPLVVEPLVVDNLVEPLVVRCLGYPPGR